MSIIQPTGIFNTSLILVLVHSSCLAKGKYIYLYVIPSSRADLMLQVGWIYTKKCSIFVHSIWVLIMCLCEDAIIGYRYSKRLVFYCRCNGLLLTTCGITHMELTVHIGMGFVKYQHL